MNVNNAIRLTVFYDGAALETSPDRTRDGAAE